MKISSDTPSFIHSSSHPSIYSLCLFGKVSKQVFAELLFLNSFAPRPSDECQSRKRLALSILRGGVKGHTSGFHVAACESRRGGRPLSPIFTMPLCHYAAISAAPGAWPHNGTDIYVSQQGSKHTHTSANTRTHTQLRSGPQIQDAIKLEKNNTCA